VWAAAFIADARGRRQATPLQNGQTGKPCGFGDGYEFADETTGIVQRKDSVA